MTPQINSRSGRRLRNSAWMASLTVRGEFSAITLEEHSLGRSERGPVGTNCSAAPGRACCARHQPSGARQADHQLIAAVTRPAGNDGWRSCLRPEARLASLSEHSTPYARAQHDPVVIARERQLGPAPTASDQRKYQSYTAYAHLSYGLHRQLVPRGAPAHRRAGLTGARPHSRTGSSPISPSSMLELVRGQRSRSALRPRPQSVIRLQ